MRYNPIYTINQSIRRGRSLNGNFNKGCNSLATNKLQRKRELQVSVLGIGRFDQRYIGGKALYSLRTAKYLASGDHDDNADGHDEETNVNNNVAIY